MFRTADTAKPWPSSITRQIEFLAFATERDRHVLRAAVDAVPKRFLSDTEEADRHIGIDGPDVVAAPEQHLDVLPLRHFLAMRSQRGRNIEQALDGRVEIVRQPPNALERPRASRSSSWMSCCDSGAWRLPVA